MTDKVNKGAVSIRPSEFASEPQPLDTSDKKVMTSVVRLGLDEFTNLYRPPSKDNRGYLHISYQPEVWMDCVGKFSENHLFLYSFCLAEHDLKELLSVRKGAVAVCRERKSEGDMLWLARRPKYELRMSCIPNQRQFPAWDEDIKNALCSLASKRCGTSGRIVLIVYSCKAMLESEVTLDWRDLLEQEVESWDNWLRGEVDKIKRYFSLV